ncbi:hypothetical protein [Halalkalibacter akibai]|uniref:Lipoprotein n=1 Tax=Halalkalibacter akibai (strain ATCC 43226 / DSM 21942 / CIP 109018 / JCM 9157 / 1139) TaxID=1236973 RepID=W4QNJ6_HALA3|nr:hypothetical protein [Halalkalibacter akibai]GAE33690.1 hypothetical protein JCM9157_711 [Halalkalibacter akibai JCM 9157]
MKPKTDKLLKGLLSSSVALMGLTACSPAMQEELFQTPAEPDPTVQPDPDLLPSPEEADCDTWTWDEEAEGYQCVEQGNQNYGHYYYGGSWFPTIAAFMAGRAMAGGGGGTRTRQPAVTQPGRDTNVNQPNPNQQQPRSPNQAGNPRSGMGGGGTFGG